ncbi:MAG: hypothetical protein QN157_13525 [Armatimonadota bacterium]|nr:hypothetical protein [Armatimonadota bacterium]
MIFVVLAYLAVVVGVGCYVLTLFARQRLVRELVDASRPSANEGVPVLRDARER